MKRVIGAGMLIMLLASVTVLALEDKDCENKKVTILHKDKVEIEVDAHSLEAHLAHGDKVIIDPCEEGPGGKDVDQPGDYGSDYGDDGASEEEGEG